MSEQIKYEAVFGNQELFDGAGTFTGLDVVLHSIASGIKSYARSSDLTPESLRNHPICAMRRIIKSPVWTKADQQAGKLPDVGCVVMVGPETKATITAHDSIQKVFSVQCENESLDILKLHEILPVETQEDRARRVREEWCNSAAKLLKNLEYSSTLTSIYDALLSGELKMPEVQK